MKNKPKTKKRRLKLKSRFIVNSFVRVSGHTGIISAGFKDFLLKPEILRAINDCGFEHPSEVQQACIPQSILG